MDSRPDDLVAVSLPASLLSKSEQPLASPELRGDAVDHQRLVYGAPDAIDQGVPLLCGGVEIMNDLPGRVQQLRQLREGIELRGFTRIPIEWSWGSNSCRPRLLEADRDGTPPPPTPAGYVQYDASAAKTALGYLKTGKPLYTVEPTANAASANWSAASSR